MSNEVVSNGAQRPATIDSPSKRPTFFKPNPHLGGKIALEERVNTNIFNPCTPAPFTEGSGELGYYEKACVDDISFRLACIEERVKHTDAGGVAISAVSLTMPSIEGNFDTTKAVEIASKVNDQMHKLCRTGAAREPLPYLGLCSDAGSTRSSKGSREVCQGTWLLWHPNQRLFQRGYRRRGPVSRRTAMRPVLGKVGRVGRFVVSTPADPSRATSSWRGACGVLVARPLNTPCV